MKIELEKQEHNVVVMNIEFPAKDAVEAYNNNAENIDLNYENIWKKFISIDKIADFVLK